MTQPDTNASTQRRVVCAAIKKDGITICGARHFDDIMCQTIVREGLDMRDAEQGFIDQRGIFLNRSDALDVAIFADQLLPDKTHPINKLFSEDLY